MGIARRIAELCQEKVNALLDRAEDPREMLDYSRAQQQESLRRMRSALAGVRTSHNRARAQEDELRRAADRMRAQAERALAAGEEGLARDVLVYREQMIARADDLAAGQAALRAEEERLAEEIRRLEAGFEAFRHREEALKAACTGAGTAAARPPAGPSATMADVLAAARRAEDQAAALQAQAAALQAQAAALSERIKAGGPVIRPSADAYRLQEQLDALSRDAVVAEELAAIRAQLRRRSGKPHGKGSGSA
jgi:phage shock protein A